MYIVVQRVINEFFSLFMVGAFLSCSVCICILTLFTVHFSLGIHFNNVCHVIILCLIDTLLTRYTFQQCMSRLEFMISLCSVGTLLTRYTFQQCI